MHSATKVDSKSSLKIVSASNVSVAANQPRSCSRCQAKRSRISPNSPLATSVFARSPEPVLTSSSIILSGPKNIACIILPKTTVCQMAWFHRICGHVEWLAIATGTTPQTGGPSTQRMLTIKLPELFARYTVAA